MSGKEMTALIILLISIVLMVGHCQVQEYANQRHNTSIAAETALEAARLESVRSRCESCGK